MRNWRVVGAAVVIATLVCDLAAKQTGFDSNEDSVEQSFVRSVEHYMVLQRQATSGLPPLNSSLNVETIRLAVDARAEAIRAARPNARAGDLFTPAVAALFRDRIRDSLAEDGYTETAMLRMVDEDTDLDHIPVLEVNGWFPWEFGSCILPSVLATLPPLPDGLEFRFIHADLVLVDVDASLVVDVLPGVLRESLYASSRGFAPSGYFMPPAEHSSNGLARRLL
jgi:hypothetical protein